MENGRRDALSAFPQPVIWPSSIYLFGCAYLQSEIDRTGLALFGPVATVDAGYQDSLLRWLFYFNPVARLGEFFLGMAAAHLFLQRKSSLASLRSTQTSMLVFAAVVGAVAIHIFLYDVVASRSVTIGRIASPLYAPAVAVVMYLVARYDTFSSRFFSSPLLVRFGEASYSIYLLHEVLPSLYKRLGILAIDPSLFWPMWGGSLVLLAIISRGSYVYFERPARFAIRKWLAPKSTSIMKRVKFRRFGRTLFVDTNSAARTRTGRVENEARKEYARANVEQ